MSTSYRTPFEFGCAFVNCLEGVRKVLGLCEMAAGLAAAGARDAAGRVFAEARELAAGLDAKDALNGALALAAAAARLGDRDATCAAVGSARSAIAQLQGTQRAFGFLNLAQHFRETGALPDALAALDEAHAATRSAEGMDRIRAISDIAADYGRCGNAARSSLLRLEIAEVIHALTNEEERSSGYGLLAGMYAAAGDTPAARDALGRAFAGFTAQTDPWTRLCTCCDCAVANAKLGATGETAHLLAEADNLIRQTQDPGSHRMCLLFAGLARVELGDADAALRQVASGTPAEQVGVASSLAQNLWRQTPTSPAVAGFLALALAAFPALPPGRERKRAQGSLILSCLVVGSVEFTPAQQELAVAAAAALAAGG